MDPQHPWAISGRVDRSEIPRQNYVLYHRNSFTFRLVEEHFRNVGMVLNLFVELGSMEAIKELVKLGLGVSIMAPWIFRGELRDKTLVALPLGKKKLRRHWGVLRRRGKRPSLAEETFVTLSRSVCGKLAEQPELLGKTD
jgi:DNA-binding transcriptional LysR family regulator